MTSEEQIKQLEIHISTDAMIIEHLQECISTQQKQYESIIKKLTKYINKTIPELLCTKENADD